MFPAYLAVIYWGYYVVNLPKRMMTASYKMTGPFTPG